MADEKSRYRDARPVERRIVVNGILELTSPAHFGGNDPLNLSDSPVLRDADGKPFVPGTTITGLLRSHVSTVLGTDGEKENPAIVSLFGCRWGEDGEDQASLIVEDAPVADAQTVTELRDGVKIDSETGTAQDKKKYDMEYLPMGTCFQLGFEILLHGEDGDTDRLNLFFTALKGLENGEISIGARTRRGHGRCRGRDWRYRIFDVQKPDGLLRWLGSNGGVPEDWPKAEESAAATVDDMMNAFENDRISLPEPAAVNRMTVTLSLSCPGSLLIRSGGHDPQEADAVHLHRLKQGSTDRTPVLSGTSLGGVLRHRALKIVNTLAGQPGHPKARDLVENLFGTDMDSGKAPKASRVWTEEAELKGDPERLRHVRVRIDRWRGGAVEHMLFDADALFGSTVDVKWKVVNPSDDEIGLMLCLVKDLFTDDLPVGGETSIGRGILYGTAGDIVIEKNGNTTRIRLTGDGKGSLNAEEGGGAAESYFTALNSRFQREAA